MSSSGTVRGQPLGWLRLEALAVFIVAITLYARGGYSWIWFAVLFLAPDITFVAYLAGPRVGAVFYNVVHSYVTPVVLWGVLHFAGVSSGIPLIWISHIGMDRAIGYGLKYEAGFGYTHLGRTGKSRRTGGG
jgi:hypothetical protein